MITEVDIYFTGVYGGSSQQKPAYSGTACVFTAQLFNDLTLCLKLAQSGPARVGIIRSATVRC
jgi:hypothetical protein